MLRHLSRATLTRGHTFATGAAARATPRIAICGAGVSGLTLAGILSNGTRDVQLTVFERARADRDQGYGLDLDEHGQEALVRAGVYDRYWDISYPYSDTSVGYQFSGGEPLSEYAGAATVSADGNMADVVMGAPTRPRAPTSTQAFRRLRTP